MSLLRELFEKFSRYHYGQFVAKADDLLPLSLLRFAEVHPDSRARIDRIAGLLTPGNGRHNANPEIYPPLHRLAAGEEPAAAEADVRLLELHLGLVDPGSLSGFSDGCYRLPEIAGEVFLVREGGAEALSPRPYGAVPGLKARVYFPFPGLFRDLLPERDYPASPDLPDRQVEVARLRAAARSVSDYSAPLFDELDAFISTVALLPARSPLFSTSLRLSYFRAIFLNASREDVDVDVLAEQMIHEFYHQRMRQWWFYEPVEGLPEEDVVMLSPISGKHRPVSVMLQALLIYVEAIRYHTWSQSRPEPPDASLSRERLKLLDRQVPALVTRLRELAPAGSEFAEQVAFLAEALQQPAEQAPAGMAARS